MKIAILVQDISTLGGVEIVSVWLAKKLSEDNEVEIVSCGNNERRTFENSEDLMIEYLNLVLEKGKLNKFSYNKIEDFFSEKKFDIVILQAGTAIQKLCFLSDANLCRIISRYSKLYYVLHGSPKYHLKRYNTACDKFPKYLLKIIYHKIKYARNVLSFFKNSEKYVTQFVTLSKGCQSEMKECYGINSIVMYNPYSFDSSDIDLRKKENTVLYAGRLSPEKDVFLILESWKLVDHNGWKLKIVGDGTEKDRLRNYAVQNNLKNLEFTGPLPHEKLIGEFKKSKIFMLCSFFEGFPTVITEAMNYKNVPVVTKYEGFSDELLQNNNSFVCERNAKKISQKLETLMLNSKLLWQFAENGYSRCKEFYENLTNKNYELKEYK